MSPFNSPPFPSINPHSPFIAFLLLFILLRFSLATTLTSLCSHPLPLPSPTLPSPSYPSEFFTISSGSFSGGSPFFSSSPPLTLPNSFSFLTKSSFHTTSPSLIRVSGTLILRGTPPIHPNRSLLHLVKPRIPRHRPFVRHASVSFDLDGFWSESDSIICMSGEGIVLSAQGNDNSNHPNAIFKLDFSKSSNLSNPFVTGVLQSLDKTTSTNYFNPISLVSFAEKNYEYTQVDKAENFCGGLSNNEQSRGLDGNFTCNKLRTMLEGGFKLQYGKNCLNGFCNPLRGDLGLDEDFMFLDQIDCSDDGKVHMYMLFTNQTRSIYRNFVIGEKALVGEGLWDREKNRLCLLGCNVLVSEESSQKILSIGECNFRINFWFPLTWNLKTRSVVVGGVSREETEGKKVISFSSTANYRSNFGGLKYEYTKLDTVRGLCAKVDSKKQNKDSYPDGKSYRDMRFQFNIKSKEGLSNFGSALPISIGENFYNAIDLSGNSTNLELSEGYFNITYKIQYNVPFLSSEISNEKIEISAEGIYEYKTGTLCLIGCRYLGNLEIAKKGRVNDSLDCEILVNFQFGPLNGKPKEHVKGVIKSLRANSDPFYFNQLEISSYGIYVEQASESIFRMDIEITMVLVSLTLTCVFLGLQLYHLKKNPKFLPYISIIMLVVLALGDMIPLVLNFDALFFMRRSKQNVLVWSGGWLEVNEIIIRVLTMVNFLLQLRLLQVAWSSRSNDESKMGYWVFEKKTLIICFPLYLFGALSALLFHMKNNRVQHTIWEDLISYAGLILDGFLIPQVFFNVFSNLKEKTLANCFYLGFTLVRALPHAYDVYRSHHYVPYIKSSYIYASPDEDIYTLAWDIIVPFGGFLVCILVFLQQRFGGAFFLPSSMKKSSEYEMVPVSSRSN